MTLTTCCMLKMHSNVCNSFLQIYFFTRGRVGVEDPSTVQDLQRSFFVLRPLPDGAKLTDGAIQDVGNNRLIALPKVNRKHRSHSLSFANSMC